jgi:hypothetical protein
LIGNDERAKVKAVADVVSFENEVDSITCLSDAT